MREIARPVLSGLVLERLLVLFLGAIFTERMVLNVTCGAHLRVRCCGRKPHRSGAPNDFWFPYIPLMAVFCWSDETTLCFCVLVNSWNTTTTVQSIAAGMAPADAHFFGGGAPLKKRLAFVEGCFLRVPVGLLRVFEAF